MYRTPFTHNRQASRYDANNPFSTKPKLARTPYNAAASMRRIEVAQTPAPIATSMKDRPSVAEKTPAASRPSAAPNTNILTPFEFHKFVRAFRSPPNTTATASKSVKKSLLQHLTASDKENDGNVDNSSTIPTKTITVSASIARRSPKHCALDNSTPFKPRKVLQRTPPAVSAAVASVSPNTATLEPNELITDVSALTAKSVCSPVAEKEPLSDPVELTTVDTICYSTGEAHINEEIMPITANESSKVEPASVNVTISPDNEVSDAPESADACPVTSAATIGTTSHTALLVITSSLSSMQSSIITLAAKLKNRDTSTTLLQLQAKKLLSATKSVGTSMTPNKNSVEAEVQTSPIVTAITTAVATTDIPLFAVENDDVCVGGLSDDDTESTNNNTTMPLIPTAPKPTLTANSGGMLSELLPAPARHVKMTNEASSITPASSDIASVNSNEFIPDEIPSEDTDPLPVSMDPSLPDTHYASTNIDYCMSNADSTCSDIAPSNIPANMRLELIPTSGRGSKKKTIPTTETAGSSVSSSTSAAEHIKEKKQKEKKQAKRDGKSKSKITQSASTVSSADNNAAHDGEHIDEKNQKEKKQAKKKNAEKRKVSTVSSHPGYSSFYDSMFPIVSAQQTTNNNIAVTIEGMWEVMTAEEKKQWNCNNNTETQPKKKQKSSSVKPSATADVIDRSTAAVQTAAKMTTKATKKSNSIKKQSAVAYCKQICSKFVASSAVLVTNESEEPTPVETAKPMSKKGKQTKQLLTTTKPADEKVNGTMTSVVSSVVPISNEREDSIPVVTADVKSKKDKQTKHLLTTSKPADENVNNTMISVADATHVATPIAKYNGPKLKMKKK